MNPSKMRHPRSPSGDQRVHLEYFQIVPADVFRDGPSDGFAVEGDACGEADRHPALACIAAMGMGEGDRRDLVADGVGGGFEVHGRED